MKKNELGNIIVSILIIMLGTILLIYPLFSLDNLTNLIYILMGLYAIIKFLQYIFLRNGDEDRENLYTGFICTLASLAGFSLSEYSSVIVLAWIMLSWIGIMVIIKLIKLQYLKKKSYSLFFVHIVTLWLFILLGILTSLNLFKAISIQTLMLGYFFIVVGIIDLAQIITEILINNKKILKLLSRKK